MTTLSIEIPDERLRLLERRATDLGISLEELLRVSINDLLAQPDEHIQQAIDYVLRKNEDLYRRLA